MENTNPPKPYLKSSKKRNKSLKDAMARNRGEQPGGKPKRKKDHYLESSTKLKSRAAPGTRIEERYAKKNEGTYRCQEDDFENPETREAIQKEKAYVKAVANGKN